MAACQAQPATPADGRSCEERRAQLMDVLSKLPETGLAAPIEVGLPSSTLSGSVGKGSILELAPGRIALDGQVVNGDELDAQLTELRQRAAGLDPKLPIYVAASWDFEVGALQPYLDAIPEAYELRLMYSVPPAPVTAGGGEPAHSGMHLAARILAERDVQKRHALANQGYADYAQCEAVERAAASFQGLSAKQRWPAVRSSMLDALPKCDCDALEADALRHLLVAEQRAGTVSLGAIPASYLRDRRCSAAMPLDSTQQLLDEIDEFDAEFAGDWKEDALVFDKVVTDERLLVYLCVALPGETLAWVQRKRDTMYWRPPGSARCQPWQFEQLARGAPMGTWRRAAGEGPPLAIHYRQGASEIRLFGPATAQSKATDDGPWPCDETFKMVGADADAIALEGNGRWYYERESCEAAPATEAEFKGCVANLAVGVPPPPPADTVGEAGAAETTRPPVGGASSGPVPARPKE